MDRTDLEWMEICEKITAGYLPAECKRATFATSGLLVDRLLYWYEHCNKPLPVLGSKFRLLDLGCGNGRLPMGLIYNGFTDMNYLGVDVIMPCLQFCMMAFSPWPNFKFDHNNVRNEWYWKRTARKPDDFDLAIKSGFAHMVFANSLFTHLGKPATALHYLEEIHRILQKGGISISTWGIAETNSEVSYSEKQSVYLYPDIQDFHSKSGLEIVGTRKCYTTPQIEICSVKG